MNIRDSWGSSFNPPTCHSNAHAATDSGSTDWWNTVREPMFRNGKYPDESAGSIENAMEFATMRRRLSSQPTNAPTRATDAMTIDAQSAMPGSVADRRANIRAARLSIVCYMLLLATPVLGCLVGTGALPFAP